MSQQKRGWSWLGFFFGCYYYAGYGNLTKSIILAIISGIMPLFALLINIYVALKAKQELPIGEVEFNWKNVGIAVLVSVITTIISLTLIESLKR